MRITQRSFCDTIASLTNLPPVLQRIYASRGITDETQLDKRLQMLQPFDQLKDIDKACERLEQALAEQQRVLIVGDFDADGATSTALAVSALRTFGMKQVDFLVPNRFEFGYGLTPAIIDVAKARTPDLIITVDNGISSIEGVDAANAAGIDVLVTDHHLPGETLPAACAIVNPNQSEDAFPSKSIAGVGVIFYVMLAFRRHLVEAGWFEANAQEVPNMAAFLDLVALGTVADVVGLDQNNRILVNQGLARIRQGLCRPGLLALIAVAGREYQRLRESDLGFAVAPRLNAAGRLDDMSLGIACLLSETMDAAMELATHLDDLNKERREIETQMKEQALQTISTLTQKIEQGQHLPVALCMLDESWHQGVIGILAGRLKERYHRPVIIFAAVSDTEIKGSARSVNGINIRDILATVDKDHPGLIEKFGGHAMAAGLSLKKDDFKAFQQAFVTEVSRHLQPSECEGELLTDGELQADDFTLETARLIQEAGPWGQQFPEPCFDNVMEILDQRLVGQNHLKLTLAHPQSGEVLDGIAFNIDKNKWPNHRVRRVHVAYKLDINVYQGRSRLQLMIEAMEPLPDTENTATSV